MGEEAKKMSRREEDDERMSIFIFFGSIHKVSILSF